MKVSQKAQENMLSGNLATKIKEKGSSYAELARKTGKSPRTISNIANGEVQNPNVYTVRIIVEVLDCYIKDLIEEKESTQESKIYIKYNDDLLHLTFNYVTDFIQNQNITECNFIDILCVIPEIYEYSSSGKSNYIDIHFAEWLCKNIFKKTPKKNKFHDNLNEMMKREGITLPTLAKRTGMLYETLLNIRNGKIESPGVYTAQIMAKALNSSVDELVNTKKPRKFIFTKTNQFLEYNKALLHTTFDYVKFFIKKNNSTKCNFTDVMYAIAEIYEYSLNKSSQELDVCFAESFCKKQI